jgi:hypothetical protein
MGENLIESLKNEPVHVLGNWRIAVKWCGNESLGAF